eukprot:scaffold164864_cov29-Tisochrysis_lutea.AAC.2
MAERRCFPNRWIRAVNDAAGAQASALTVVRAGVAHMLRNEHAGVGELVVVDIGAWDVSGAPGCAAPVEVRVKQQGHCVASPHACHHREQFGDGPDGAHPHPRVKKAESGTAWLWRVEGLQLLRI